MSDSRTLSVPAEAAGQRLDFFLSQALTSESETVSRSRIQSLVDEEKILVNAKPAKSSFKLRGNEQITITGTLTLAPLKATAEKIKLDVVYEDSDLAVINKPAGMMVHAGSGQNESARSEGTLVNALLHKFKKLSTVGGELRPGIVHRLDKETSGLIIIAKNNKTHEKLAEMFAEREMKKIYYALVQGWLERDSGTINAPLGRDPQRRTRMTTRNAENPRTAITHYKVERRIQSRFGKFTLIRLRIETGRTHQIRVHMASLRHPVVGDTLYGASGRQVAQNKGMRRPKDLESLRLGRNFLHAGVLEFIQPNTGQLLKLSAPLPQELTDYLARLETGLQ